jgi:cyclic-di-GMP-binding biofilm dispersal mediator protein
MGDFSGKAVMVLGGSRGIGAAIVRHFAAAGASVTFSYSGSADAAAAIAAETGATMVQADSANLDELVAAIAAAGGHDIMVINAGVAIIGDPLTLVAGMLRERLVVFLALVLLSKASRYVALTLITLGLLA